MKYRPISPEARQRMCDDQAAILRAADTRADERQTTTTCHYCPAQVPVPEMGADTGGLPPMCERCRAIRDDMRSEK